MIGTHLRQLLFNFLRAGASSILQIRDIEAAVAMADILLWRFQQHRRCVIGVIIFFIAWFNCVLAVISIGCGGHRKTQEQVLELL